MHFQVNVLSLLHNQMHIINYICIWKAAFSLQTVRSYRSMSEIRLLYVYIINMKCQFVKTWCWKCQFCLSLAVSWLKKGFNMAFTCTSNHTFCWKRDWVNDLMCTESTVKPAHIVQQPVTEVNVCSIIWLFKFIKICYCVQVTFIFSFVAVNAEPRKKYKEVL